MTDITGGVARRLASYLFYIMHIVTHLIEPISTFSLNPQPDEPTSLL